MIKKILAICLLIALTACNESNKSGMSLGSGTDYVIQCSVVDAVVNDKPINRFDLDHLNYCLGYVNGMAQMSSNPNINGKTIIELSYSYFRYLKSDDGQAQLQKDNSVLFNQMLKKYYSK